MSAFFIFTMVVVMVSDYALVSSPAFVYSSASKVVGSAFSVIVTLVDLLLEICYGVHECLYLYHHGLVLV